MPILDKTKIKPDILRIIERNIEIQLEAGMEYFSRAENQGAEIQEYIRKISIGKRKYYENIANGKDALDGLRGVLTREQMVLTAALFRYSLDRVSDYYLKQTPIPSEVKIEKTDLNGVPAEWQVVPGAASSRVLLYFHGGGQNLGSAKSHRLLTVEMGRITKMSVLSVEYRLAPEHPFPAGVEDTFSSYRWLLEKGFKPKEIVIGGDSSGGSQVITTLLQIRDAEVEAPAGAFALCPAIDYTNEGTTRYTNRQTDYLSDAGIFWWDLSYLDGSDPYHPLISPLFTDLRGLPPMLIQVTSNEILYDHSTRFVQRAEASGVDITLQEWPDLMHVWQHYGLYELPEAKEALDRIGEFVRRALG